MVEEDSESLRKSLRIYKGLVEVSVLINSITDYGELLRAILDVARRVIRAEAASLFLVRPESGDLELAIATRGDCEYVEPKLSVPRGKGIAGCVLECGNGLLIPDAYADARFYKEADRQTGFTTRSIVCVPLKSDQKVIGVLQVLNPREKSAFEPEDLDGLSAYATLTATAIEKLRALERIRAQERVERDLAIAAEIQCELLSRAVPAASPGVCFAVHNTPAANVGGDFYGVFPRGDGETLFAVGDVSGKGISASLLMAQVLSALQFVCGETPLPSDVLRRLNGTLHKNSIRGMFITMLVGRMLPDSRRVELASAGHCPPLLVTAGGLATRIDVVSALPLGILPDVTYRQSEISLAPGDRIVAYTDGLSESRREGDGEQFDEQLLEYVGGRAANVQAILDRLLAAEHAHRGDSHQLDDLTILVGGFE